jgi:hypothetical protein
MPLHVVEGFSHVAEPLHVAKDEIERPPDSLSVVELAVDLDAPLRRMNASTVAGLATG